jgi:hypothetical protein
MSGTERGSRDPAPTWLDMWSRARERRLAKRRRQEEESFDYTPEKPVREEYLYGLQKDAMILLRYVAGRPDRPLAMLNARESSEISATVFSSGPDSDSDARIDDLQNLLDQLSRLAAPATATSIRLTQAYLLNPSIDGEPPRVIRRQARKLRQRIYWIRALTIAIFLVTVVTLVHVTFGRQALDQLRQQQGVLTVLEDRLALATPTEGRPSHWNDCDTRPASNGTISDGQEARAAGSGATAARDQACFRRDLVMKEQETSRSLLGIWNCASSLVFGRWRPWLGCPAETTRAQPAPASAAPPLGAPAATITDNSASIIAANFLGTFNSFILPMLVGTLGGCAYVLRRLDSKIREMTLEASDASHAGFRIALAAIMGSLLGVVWDGGTQVQMGELSLSVTALAFFVGFSLEIVFSVIEAMVGSIAGRLNNGPGPLPAAPFMPLPPRKIPVEKEAQVNKPSPAAP